MKLKCGLYIAYYFFVSCMSILLSEVDNLFSTVYNLMTFQDFISINDKFLEFQKPYSKQKYILVNGIVKFKNNFNYIHLTYLLL